MGITVVGDADKACLACNTGMEAFGPLHTQFKDGDAAADMRDFIDWLDEDARDLHNQARLRAEWHRFRDEELER